MNKVYLSLGSNLGDKENNIEKAIVLLNDKLGDILLKSSFFYSKAFEFESESDFVNNVILVQTSFSPFETLAITKKIELELGRTQKSINKVYKDRIIDIDILYFNDEIIDDLNLKIPHPEIVKREFVYVPLLEINPEIVDPFKNDSLINLIIIKKN